MSAQKSKKDDHRGNLVVAGIGATCFPVIIFLITYLNVDYIGDVLDFSEREREFIPIYIFIVGSLASHTFLYTYNEKLIGERISEIVSEVIVPDLDSKLGGASSVDNVFDKEYLSPEQIHLKRILNYDIATRHGKRFVALKANQWFRLYNFGIIIGKLCDFLFASKPDQKSILRDYTVAYNADEIFRDYSFATYFKDLFKQRKKYSICQTKIRILIRCDFDPEQIGNFSSREVPQNSKNGGPDDAARHFELCLKELFQEYKKRFPVKSLKLDSIYREASRDDRGDFAIRIISSSGVKRVASKHEAQTEHPFNVYDDLAVSKSVVRYFDREEMRPVPHVEVSLHTEIVEAYRLLFDAMWEVAGDEAEEVFRDGETLKDLGTRQIVKRLIAK